MLAEVEARTLKPVSAARVPLGTFGLWSFSPKRNALAVSTGFVPRSGTPTPVQLRFVDVASEVAGEIASIVASLPALESLRPEPRRIVVGEYLLEPHPV